MSHRDPEYLVKNAKGDIDKKEISKPDGVLSTIWHGYEPLDKQLIEYLEEREQPHFLIKLNEERNIVKNSYEGISDKEGSNNLFRYHHNIREEYLLITDRRFLYVVGHKSGDLSFSLPYNLIQDSSIRVGSDGMVEVTDIQGYVYQTNADVTEGLKHYVQQKIENTKYEQSTPPSGSFYVASADSSSGEPSDLLIDGQYNVEFGSDSFNVSGENTDIELSYDDIMSVRFYRGFHPSFDSEPYSYYVNGANSDAICLSLNSCDQSEVVHLCLMANLREKHWWGSFDNKPKHLEIEECFNYLKENTLPEEDADEKYVLNEWMESQAKLKIQEWDDRSVSTGSSMEGSIETKGKSRGVQIGPFIRSKSKSESEIQLEDSSISIDSGGYTERIDCCIIYDDRIFVDTDPVIDISYEDIERVMRKERGIAIQFGELTYSVEKIKRKKNELESVVEFITEKIQRFGPDTEKESTYPTEQIRELKELEEDGIITEEEFESKKQELLDQI